MNVTRRAFLRSTTAAAMGLAGCRSRGGTTGAARPGSSSTQAAGVWVNDIHSQLNRTRVAGIERPSNLDQLLNLIGDARRQRSSISVCGGRHAAGGQQFRTNRMLIDTSGLSRVLAFDGQAGTVDVEAGIQWPTLLADLHARDNPQGWSIRQKQGGADQLSLGGAIGSNIHSRHLSRRPFVGDIERVTLVSPRGEALVCGREQRADLFRHVVGGYGLFGVVYAVRLRLEKRQKLVRYVHWLPADAAVATLEARRDSGAWHGDFQFDIDPASPTFCAAGLCTWYEPTAADRPVRAREPAQTAAAFAGLVGLAHQDKSLAMRTYREALIASSGQVVDYSDDWLQGDYVPDYHRAIDGPRGGPGAEILSELHVPRPALAGFLAEAARVLREDGAELIYGVVRLIEADFETALPWAKQPYACVIFNLHTQLDAASIERNAATFRRLLDAAIRYDGSYYLTYHRFARPDQVERCYPRFRAFLAAKEANDPEGTLDSDWYQFYRRLLPA